MAFLVLTGKRLTPMERAVFLLRKFSTTKRRGSQNAGQNEANCRQILRRARQHVAERARDSMRRAGRREKIAYQFLNATSQGDLNGLVALSFQRSGAPFDSGGKSAQSRT